MILSQLVCIIVYKQVGIRGEGHIDLDASKRKNGFVNVFLLWWEYWLLGDSYEEDG